MPYAPIETERLLIRRFTPDDAPFILDLLNEPGWLRFIGDKGIRTVEEARRYIERGPMASYEAHGFGLSMVEIRETGAAAGMAGLIRREGLEDVDVGFAFLERHMGRGYAREAAEAVVAQGWDLFGLARIVAITTPDNERSIRLLEAIGFRFERMFRMPGGDEDLNLYARERPSAAASPAPPGGIPMNHETKSTIWRQFGAAIDMLENAVNACPEPLWGDRSRNPEYWYLVYHTLFFLDYYLAESKDGFTPPAPFNLDELDPAGILPERVYTKAELLAYLAHGRRKAKAVIGALTEEGAREHRPFGSIDCPFLELLLYNMRHVQHHAAQLNLILRQQIDSAPRWVRWAPDDLERG